MGISFEDQGIHLAYESLFCSRRLLMEREEGSMIKNFLGFEGRAGGITSGALTRTLYIYSMTCLP